MKNKKKIIIFCFLAILLLKNCANIQVEKEPSKPFGGDMSAYVDSCATHYLELPGADSIIFCSLKEGLPNVMAGELIVEIWKKGRKVNHEECMKDINGYFSFSKGQYFFYIIRQKTIFFYQMKISTEIICFNEQLYSLTSHPCAEFYNLKTINKLTDHELIIHATKYDFCFDYFADTTLFYRIKNHK